MKHYCGFKESSVVRKHCSCSYAVVVDKIFVINIVLRFNKVLQQYVRKDTNTSVVHARIVSRCGGLLLIIKLKGTALQLKNGTPNSKY